MGIFSNIMSKIFGHKPKTAPSPAPTPAQAPTPTAAAPTPAPEPVDVTAVLDDLAANNPQKLDWRHSIVDLMKLVGMESSLAERKDLADELGFSGDNREIGRASCRERVSVVV